MEQLFEKYRKRLMHIGIFKSAMLSLAFSLISMGIAALVTWIADASILLTLVLALGIGAGTLVISIFLLYFKCFRPTSQTVARGLDGLGLDERYITMLECRENNSEMAKLQREDAKAKLSGISSKQFKYTIALPIVLLLVFGFTFAAGTTTMSMLSAADVFISEETQTIPEEKTQTFTVTYRIYEEGTGTINGEAVQKVEKGHYTKAVAAIPAKGYHFVAWVDVNANRLANQSNPRTEINVREDMVIYALFEKNKQIDEDADGELEKGDDSQNPDKGDDGDDDSKGEDGGGQTGQGNSGSSGSKDRQNNKVIDGTQDYKEDFDRGSFENELEDRNVPDELKDILGDYYETLKP